ncbi:MAG: AbrB/MazE/SpoVT family DNA-binding domain-containing protein [Deltaproteobacteria bacterium]|nr:AbrB/MazE/SpoVT family DNA-binding domain-containing protein [Deltaproteobacteria bacterium]
MRITSKGQVTIPQELRDQLGFVPGSEVTFIPEGNTLRVVKQEGPAGRGRSLVDRLRGKATVSMTTDEILALTRGD